MQPGRSESVINHGKRAQPGQSSARPVSSHRFTPRQTFTTSGPQGEERLITFEKLFAL